MDDFDVQKQIEERKVQATERGIFGKAVHAACHLGEGYHDRRERGRSSCETRMIYNDSDTVTGLTIDFGRTVDDQYETYETVEILEGEETVFLQKGGTVEGYIPGDWEVELDKLQRPADRAKEDAAKVVEKEKQATGSERASALRKAWGLSDKDGRVRGADDPKPKLGGVMEQPLRRRRQ